VGAVCHCSRPTTSSRARIPGRRALSARLPKSKPTSGYCVIPFLLPPPKIPCPARAKKASQAGRRRFDPGRPCRVSACVPCREALKPRDRWWWAGRMGGRFPSGQWFTPRGAASGRASGPCGVCGMAPEGGIRWPHRLFGRRGSEGPGDRAPPAGFALSQGAMSRSNEDVGRITVASFGVALPAGHTGRDPSFDLGLQPTHGVRGEFTARRKLPPTLQTPECRPRQSRTRADLTASEKPGG